MANELIGKLRRNEALNPEQERAILHGIIAILEGKTDISQVDKETIRKYEEEIAGLSPEKMTAFVREIREKGIFGKREAKKAQPAPKTPINPNGIYPNLDNIPNITVPENMEGLTGQDAFFEYLNTNDEVRESISKLAMVMRLVRNYEYCILRGTTKQTILKNSTDLANLRGILEGVFSKELVMRDISSDVLTASKGTLPEIFFNALFEDKNASAEEVIKQMIRFQRVMASFSELSGYAHTDAVNDELKQWKKNPTQPISKGLISLIEKEPPYGFDLKTVQNIWGGRRRGGGSASETEAATEASKVSGTPRRGKATPRVRPESNQFVDRAELEQYCNPKMLVETFDFLQDLIVDNAYPGEDYTRADAKRELARYDLPMSAAVGIDVRNGIDIITAIARHFDLTNDMQGLAERLAEIDHHLYHSDDK